MAALYIQVATIAHDGVVQRPRSTDAIGAALRGVFGNGPTLPADMACLLQRLDRATPDS